MVEFIIDKNAILQPNILKVEIHDYLAILISACKINNNEFSLRTIYGILCVKLTGYDIDTDTGDEMYCMEVSLKNEVEDILKITFDWDALDSRLTIKVEQGNKNIDAVSVFNILKKLKPIVEGYIDAFELLEEFIDLTKSLNSDPKKELKLELLRYKIIIDFKDYINQNNFKVYGSLVINSETVDFIVTKIEGSTSLLIPNQEYSVIRFGELLYKINNLLEDKQKQVQAKGNSKKDEEQLIEIALLDQIKANNQTSNGKVLLPELFNVIKDFKNMNTGEKKIINRLYGIILLYQNLGKIRVTHFVINRKVFEVKIPPYRLICKWYLIGGVKYLCPIKLIQRESLNTEKVLDTIILFAHEYTPIEC